MSGLEDRHAVVTGAAGVLGTAVAQAFHDAGARITGIDIVAADAPWPVVIADLTDRDATAEALAGVGPVDILANIAGGFTMGDTVEATSDETWDFMFDLNARTVLNWLREAQGEAAVLNLAAVSMALDKTSEMGIAPDRVFGFADWVGGRYSLWGPVGLPIMLAVGPDNFRDFLSGGAAMDRHFRSAPLERNMPVLLGLVGIWHRNVCQYPTRAVIPYDQRLARLPAYLQQLDMESNGKRVSIEGCELELPTGPVVWGEPGTNGQHAFFQLLHQGTEVVPVEFLVAAECHEANLEEHHDLLKAN